MGIPEKQPMYRHIAEDLHRAILRGDYAADAVFCTEKALCERYGVSRITAKHAINELEKRGILYRKRGVGSFVADTATARGAKGARKKIRNFAMLVPFDISNGGIFSIIQSLTHAMSGTSSFISLYVTQSDYESEREALYNIADMDGVIYYPSSLVPADALESFAESGKPVVILDKHHDYPQFSNVVCDNAGGGYLLTEHLCAYGHEKICYLSRFPTGKLSSIRHRFDGCLQYVEKHRPAAQPRFFQLDRQGGGPLDYHLLKHSVNMLVQEGFTAIECENDEVAFYTLMCCKDLSIRVPEDISVTGYDNIEWSTAANKSITTVSQDFEKMGLAIAELLLAEEYVPRSVIVPVALVPRESTGPVKNAAP